MNPQGSDINFQDNTGDNQEKPIKESAYAEYFGNSYVRVAAGFVLLVLFFRYIRPQEILPLIGIVKLPLLVELTTCIVCFVGVLKNWNLQTRIILFFLLLQAVLGLIGYYVIDAQIRNDFWHFFTFVDLFLLCFSIVFPLSRFLAFGRVFRQISNLFVFAALYLGIYGITHQGRGPGGFLGDENDYCLVLLTLLPFPLLRLFYEKQIFKRSIFGLSTALALAGIISSMSRGGFVGLVFLLLYIFLQSRHKFASLLIGLIFSCVLILLTPQKYWDEMSTIANTTGDTAQERKEIWDVAIKVWLDPRFFLTGCGLDNTSSRLSDYESIEQRTGRKRSFGGRSVHSLYFQALGDIGLIGILIVSYFVFFSLKANRQTKLGANHLLGEYNRLSFEFVKLHKKNKQDNDTAISDSSELDYVNTALVEIDILSEQVYQAESLARILNTAWIGFLGAGLFISVLYYPPLWLMIGLSVGLKTYYQRLERLIERHQDELENSLEPITV